MTEIFSILVGILIWSLSDWYDFQISGGKKQGQARPFFSLNLYAVLSCQCCLPFGFLLAECLPTAKRLIPPSRVVTELVTLFTVSDKPRPSFFFVQLLPQHKGTVSLCGSSFNMSDLIFAPVDTC